MGELCKRVELERGQSITKWTINVPSSQTYRLILVRLSLTESEPIFNKHFKFFAMCFFLSNLIRIAYMF